MAQIDDVIGHLAGIDASSDLATSRQIRKAATQHAQGSYLAIFAVTTPDSFPQTWRATLAAQVADWHGAAALQQHYLSLTQGSKQSAGQALQAAIDFARTLTFNPLSASPDTLATLQTAGWSADDIVTLAQLVAFVSFQSRVIQGFHVIARGDDPPKSDNVTNTVSDLAGQWHTHAHTRQGQRAPVAFTRDELAWEPWLAPRPLDDFFPDEQATLTRFGHQDSPYFRLLGRNLPLLEQRTLTDKGIFYTPDGLGRAERELAATVVSKINGCIYCASVHARKAAQLSKQPAAIDTLLSTPPGASLAAGQSPQWQAIIHAAGALTQTPPRLAREHTEALRQAGLDTLAIVDVIQSAAFFAWANRLMLTLGEPWIPAPGQEDTQGTLENVAQTCR